MNEQFFSESLNSTDTRFGRENPYSFVMLNDPMKVIFFTSSMKHGHLLYEISCMMSFPTVQLPVISISVPLFVYVASFVEGSYSNKLTAFIVRRDFNCRNGSN